MKKIILRVLEFITKRKAVYLLDMDGEISMSLSYRSPFGNLTAERFWPYKVHMVVLNEDGSVSGSCVIRWKYVWPEGIEKQS